MAEWVTLMGFGKFAHSFVTHKITGKLLVQLEDMHLGNMGIGIIGVRMNMCDAISQLKRVYNKPETASLTVYVVKCMASVADHPKGRKQLQSCLDQLEVLALSQEELVKKHTLIAIERITWKP